MPEPKSDQFKNEVNGQITRQLGKFAVIYHKALLIPTDPIQNDDYSEVHGGSKVKHDLTEFYYDWFNLRKEREKHFKIAEELHGMLQKGLYVCSAEMVFKVIESIKVEYIIPSSDLNVE